MGLDALRSMEYLERVVHQVLEHLARTVAIRGSPGRRLDYVAVGELAGSAADERCSRVEDVGSDVVEVEDPAVRGEDDAVGRLWSAICARYWENKQTTIDNQTTRRDVYET